MYMYVCDINEIVQQSLSIAIPKLQVRLVITKRFLGGCQLRPQGPTPASLGTVGSFP